MKDAITQLEQAIKFADLTLFDTYSNAQKLSWREIESNCRAGLDATQRALQLIEELKEKPKVKPPPCEKCGGVGHIVGFGGGHIVDCATCQPAIH